MAYDNRDGGHLPGIALCADHVYGEHDQDAQ